MRSGKSLSLLTGICRRMVVGILLILLCNALTAQAGLSVSVGVNPFSLAAAGTLGVPGVLLLYGIAGCQYL